MWLVDLMEEVVARKFILKNSREQNFVNSIDGANALKLDESLEIKTAMNKML